MFESTGSVVRVGMLADTWHPDASGFLFGGQLARSWLRRAVDGFARREPGGFIDCIEAHARAWLAAHPNLPAALCIALRAALRDVITDAQRAHMPQSPPGPIGDILDASARFNHDNKRPPPTPHLRI